MQSRVYTVTHWVPDDTEETRLRADWHKEAIGNLHTGLKYVARAAALPWHVGNQMALIAWHPDGTPGDQSQISWSTRLLDRKVGQRWTPIAMESLFWS